MVLTDKDLPDEPTDAYKTSKKIKQVAYDALKIVQKPPKKKVVIQKDIEKVVAFTVLMPSKIRSGKIPYKTSSYFVTTDAPVKKRKLRKMILPSEIAEEEET